MRLGHAVSTWGYDHLGGPIAVVVAHSRTPHTLDDEQALEIARDQLDDTARLVGDDRWHSVTKAQRAAGDCPEEAEVGSFCHEGRGAAWVDVSLFVCGVQS